MSFLASLLGNAARNYAVSKIMGQDPSVGDVVKMTLLNQGINAAFGQGGQGNIFSNLFGGGAQDKGIAAADTANAQARNIAMDAASKKMGADAAATMKTAGQKTAADLAGPKAIKTFEQAPGTLGYSKFLVDAGILGQDNALANMLNSRVGEALATSLAMGLGSKLFDKDGDQQVGPAEKPFGGVEGYTRLNVPRRMEMGGTVNGQYFPRRNGGIMPHEGSGQKDDVPAMLMAGEFVLTKDAVKGLGNGDSRKGIDKAYSMMRSLENKANKYV